MLLASKMGSNIKQTFRTREVFEQWHHCFYTWGPLNMSRTESKDLKMAGWHSLESWSLKCTVPNSGSKSGCNRVNTCTSRNMWPMRVQSVIKKCGCWRKYVFFHNSTVSTWSAVRCSPISGFAWLRFHCSKIDRNLPSIYPRRYERGNLVTSTSNCLNMSLFLSSWLKCRWNLCRMGCCEWDDKHGCVGSQSTANCTAQDCRRMRSSHVVISLDVAVADRCWQQHGLGVRMEMQHVKEHAKPGEDVFYRLCSSKIFTTFSTPHPADSCLLSSSETEADKLELTSIWAS